MNPSGPISSTARSVTTFFYAFYASKRQGTGRQELGASLWIRVLHGYNDIPGTGDKIHRPTHSFYHFSGYFPVRDVPGIRNFHGTQNGQIHFTGPDHTKAFGAVEKGPPGKNGDRFLARIDEVGINFRLHRIGAHAEHSILRLQHDRDAGGNIIGYQRGDPDA